MVPRKNNLMMPFYPLGSADLDVAPNVIGHGTGVCVSAYTHTEEGYDIEEMEAQWAQTYRLVNKIRHHRAECTRYETLGLEDAEVVAVAYGANARTVKTGVVEARRRGVRAGFVRPITLWPFLDELYASGPALRGLRAQLRRAARARGDARRRPTRPRCTSWARAPSSTRSPRWWPVSKACARTGAFPSCPTSGRRFDR